MLTSTPDHVPSDDAIESGAVCVSGMPTVSVPACLREASATTGASSARRASRASSTEGVPMKSSRLSGPMEQPARPPATMSAVASERMR